MKALMIKEADSGTEDIKQKLRDRISTLEQRIDQDRKDLVDLRKSLGALEGEDVSVGTMFRGVSSIDCILVYLNMAGRPVNEEQMIKDLVKEGAGRGKAEKRGGPEGALRKSITQFLKTGRGSDEAPLLRRNGSEDDPKRTISLSASS